MRPPATARAWLRRRVRGSRAFSLALWAVRLADARMLWAQANSVARIAKPTKIAAHPGPGRTSMAMPAKRTITPAVNTAIRHALFKSVWRLIHARHGRTPPTIGHPAFMQVRVGIRGVTPTGGGNVLSSFHSYGS